MPRDEAGLRDRVGDGRAGRNVDWDDVLNQRRGPDDGDVHGFVAYTDSARRTNASMNVFAMWLNTGPTAFSRTWVVNS